ncbi:hypothetical protein ABZ766_29845 [Streptomyces sp. NPDC006670]|uniref:hypothetical protein n=1 Tax=Streptomyces sp. NPDC006670 TaxID=3154476 RepID=UPI0033E5E34B
MDAERAQGGRGWVRIPASRGEQPPPGTTGKPYGQGQHGAYGGGQGAYGGSQSGAYGSGQNGGAYGSGRHGSGPYAGDPAEIYLSLVKRWREAGRTLPGHPDEEWERLISQPCWPGR